MMDGLSAFVKKLRRDILDEWMTGFELKGKQRMLSFTQIIEKSIRIFLQDCFILMSLIRSHPAIQPSSHPAIQPSSHPAIQPSMVRW
jgi:hypothetical protein